MIRATAVDRHVEQLFDALKRLHAALNESGIEYRIVDGMAVFLQVSERSHDAARLTRDIDVAVDRRDLPRIAKAAQNFGFLYRHAAGVDMLGDAREPKGRSAVRMKLTSLRLTDKVHLLDLDSVGLITPEIEQELPEALRARLEQVRKEEGQSTGAE